MTMLARTTTEKISFRVALENGQRHAKAIGEIRRLKGGDKNAGFEYCRKI